MSDYGSLKAAAEACKDLLSLRYMECHGELYIGNDNCIVFQLHYNEPFTEIMIQSKAYADLVLAAMPESILGLIEAQDELVALRARLAERDALLREACPIHHELAGDLRERVEAALSGAQCSEVDPQCSELLRTQGEPAELNIEAAAKTLAACMDYPWEHMPEQGRASMREHAKAVINSSKEPS